MKLQKGKHTGSGKDIYYIQDPNTYAIRDKLGRYGLGMNYWKGMWWTYNVSPRLLDGLDKLNIDTSEVRQSLGMSVVPATGQPAPVAETPAEEPVEESAPTTELLAVDRNWSGPPELYNESASKKAGFPVRKAIYVTEIPVEVAGQSVTVTAKLNRDFAAGGDSSQYHPVIKQGYRGFPFYNISVTWEDKPIALLKISVNRKTRHPDGSVTGGPTRKWQEIDEAREIAPQVETKVKEVFANPQSKPYLLLAEFLKVSQRSPELLQYINDYKEKPFDIRDIDVPYKGQSVKVPIAVSFYKYGEDLHTRLEVVPALDLQKYPQAPDPKHKTLTYDWSIPNEVKTIEEFKQWYESSIHEQLPNIQKRYSEYLGSFPFAEEEFSAAKVEMSKILNYLVAGSIDVNEFKQRMISMGYLRPRKTRGQVGIGMVPQENIRYNILDHKKIIDDTYRWKNSNSPESFYTVMAYYLSRLKRNVTSWTEMMLVDAVNHWTRTANRFGMDMDFREVMGFFDREARRLYQTIFEESAPRSRVDQFSDFYSGFGGEGQQSRPEDRTYRPGPTGTTAFADFVASIGGDRNLALEDPKKAYNQMALKWHPDVQKDKSPENIAKCNKVFSELSQLWARTSGKSASTLNWLQKIAYQTPFKWW